MSLRLSIKVLPLRDRLTPFRNLGSFVDNPAMEHRHRMRPETLSPQFVTLSSGKRIDLGGLARLSAVEPTTSTPSILRFCSERNYFDHPLANRASSFPCKIIRPPIASSARTLHRSFNAPACQLTEARTSDPLEKEHLDRGGTQSRCSHLPQQGVHRGNVQAVVAVNTLRCSVCFTLTKM